RGWALGVDIGGTFTDLALLEEGTGRLEVGKVLTTYGDLAQGVVGGGRALLDRSGVKPRGIREIVHRTALPAHALIERRGALTALIVTEGFRDLLAMGRESRYDIFDIDLETPAPLVPRRLVFEASERLDAAGEVIRPLDRDEIIGVARRLKELRVESA